VWTFRAGVFGGADGFSSLRVEETSAYLSVVDATAVASLRDLSGSLPPSSVGSQDRLLSIRRRSAPYFSLYRVKHFQCFPRL
jgi:hypothetical protein